MKQLSNKLKLLFPLCSPMLVLEITVIVQLCIFMTFSVLLVTPRIEVHRLLNKFNHYFPENTLYFQPYERLEAWLTDDSQTASDIEERKNHFTEQVNKLFPYSSLGQVFSTTGSINGGSDIQIIAYSSSLLYSMNLSNNFINYSFPKGSIPALYRGRNHHPGEEIQVSLNLYNPITLDFIIVDNISNDSLMVLPRYGSTEPTIEDLVSFNYYDIYTGNDPGAMLIVDISFLPPPIAYLSSSSCFIFTENKIDLTSNLRNDLRKIGGNVFSKQEIILHSDQRNLQINQTPLARFISSSLFTSVSLIGYIFLSHYRNQRTLGIYMQCGLPIRSINRIYTIFIFTIFLSAIVVEILLLFILGSMGTLGSKEIPIDVILISLGYYVVIMLIANIASYFRISSLQIIENMREV